MMKFFGLLALSVARARLICGNEGGDKTCYVTCRQGGLHWSVPGPGYQFLETKFTEYHANFHGERCKPELVNGRYELTVPFGQCGLKRKVWWKDQTIHYMFTATYYNGHRYDTLHLTCSHRFQNEWYGIDETMEWAQKPKPVYSASIAQNSRVYFNPDSKSASNRQELHTLSVLSPPRGVGDRLVFAIVQQLKLPDKYFKVTNCNVHSTIDGTEYSFPILTDEVGNHLVDFRFEGKNQDQNQVVMSFKTFHFKNGTGNQSIKCKVLTCDGPCDKVSHQTPDESMQLILNDVDTLTKGMDQLVLKPFYSKLKKVTNHMMIIRRKLEHICEQTPFHDTRTISRMSAFDSKNTCPEMDLIADELMSWASIYNLDCRRTKSQTRLGKMHFQLSRAFEYFSRKFC